MVPATISNSMDDDRLASYVAGAFDWGSAFRIRVRKADQYRIGYTVEPQIQFRKKDASVMGLLDEFCSLNGVKSTVSDNEKDVWKLTIAGRDDVWRFLEAVYDYSVVRHDAIEVVLNEIRPRMDNGEHRNKQGFMELMQFVDEARSYTGRDNVKYDWQYFNEEWFDGALNSEDEIEIP